METDRTTTHQSLAIRMMPLLRNHLGAWPSRSLIGHHELRRSSGRRFRAQGDTGTASPHEWSAFASEASSPGRRIIECRFGCDDHRFDRGT